MISHTNPIPAEEVTQTVQYIKESCMFLREHLPTERAFPKMHMLEDSVAELIKKLGIRFRTYGAAWIRECTQKGECYYAKYARDQ